MDIGRPTHLVTHVPAPRFAASAWLLAPLGSIGPEGDAELRQSLIRRLHAVLFSVAVTLTVEFIATTRHPDSPVVWWFWLDLVLSSVRVPLTIYLIASMWPGRPVREIPAWMNDLFICVGTIWSALVGVGAALCTTTNDPGLLVLAILVVMGTIGAQGVRSPGSPRLNIVQMCLLFVPMIVGVATSEIPIAGWAAVLGPPYLLGMISITRELHFDYQRMILARMENRRRALHCPLTGLPNRAFFADSLAAALNRPDDAGTNVILMYLDLDGFKAVNDRFGHAAGDTLLSHVAGRLRDLPSRNAFAARLGGDEFAILLHDHRASEVEAVARDVIDALARPYNLEDGRTVRVGVSVGLGTGGAGTDVTTIMRSADQALYTAKREGRGTFRWAVDAPDAASAPPLASAA